MGGKKKCSQVSAASEHTSGQSVTFAGGFIPQVVDVKSSFVNMMPSKVEVTLKKADAVAWGKLEDAKHKPEPEVTEDISATEQETKAEERPDWYISDDDISESDWEDDDDNGDDKKGEEQDVDGPPVLEEPIPVPQKK